jgi:5'-3' exonuclease
MGIPSYFKKITNEHPNIIKTKIPRCDRLFFDFNGIIHTSCAKLRSCIDKETSQYDFEMQLLKNISKYTLEIINMVKPNKLVYICIDGVAPLSKIKQQRNRRYLSVFINKEVPDDKYVWDTNAISPGTPFMNKLNLYLKQVFSNEQLKCETIISDSSEKGEGEHKIYDYINEKKADYNDIVYGLDADLIMLSLISKNKNIHLLRENIHFNLKYNRNQNRKEQSFLVLDINSFRNSILNYYNNKIDIHSYVCMCFLLGNDFIPPLSYINIHNNGIELLANAYIKVNENIDMSLVELNEDDNYELNLLFLEKLLEILQKSEDVEFKKEHDKYYNHRGHFKVKHLEIENYGDVHKNSDLKDMFDENNWRSTYYKHLFDSNIVTNTVMKASENYLDGIIWNVGYYFNKKHMKKWFYVYNYSPTILDLWNYVTSMTSEESIKKLNLNIESIFNDININEDEQLLLVLPPQSLNIISKDYTDLLDINSGICHLYPSKFEIMTYQKSKLHTCFPILPSLEYNSINKYILSCKKSI